MKNMFLLLIFGLSSMVRADECSLKTGVPVYRTVEFSGGIQKGVRQEVERLVEQGRSYLESHDSDDSFQAFSNTKDFVLGDLYLYAFDTNGTCLAHGNQTDLIWENLWDHRDSEGKPIIQNIINTAKEGGGWLDYEWRNATKMAYVTPVCKGEKQYVLGAGYYPDSQKEAVVSLVKTAVEKFNREKVMMPPYDIFATFSYPMGKFNMGPYYLFGIDFEGNVIAQGDRPGLIGTNATNAYTNDGRQLTQEIISMAKQKPNGFWINYVRQNAPKRTYMQVITDNAGKKYVIGAGFYPTINEQAVIDLVNRGYQYIKESGLSVAADEFSVRTKDKFKYGHLTLFVYNMKGKLIADGANPNILGQYYWDAKDEDGKYYVREYIQKARDGGGWVRVKLDNMYKSVYVRKINLGIKDYVIGCGYYAVADKGEAMRVLSHAGADYLESNKKEVAFRDFTDDSKKFIAGDLEIFAFDKNGVCYAYGDQDALIWQNMKDFKDDNGKKFVQEMIDKVVFGAGEVNFVLNGAEKIAYIQPVEKDGKTFIVGSSYYPHKGERKLIVPTVKHTIEPTCPV